MTFIVTENCINCKFQDCVAVCPVDCFYEGENFLVIHPQIELGVYIFYYLFWSWCHYSYESKDC